jgi:hypothetical protein
MPESKFDAMTDAEIDQLVTALDQYEEWKRRFNAVEWAVDQMSAGDQRFFTRLIRDIPHKKNPSVESTTEGEVISSS